MYLHNFHEKLFPMHKVRGTILYRNLFSAGLHSPHKMQCLKIEHTIRWAVTFRGLSYVVTSTYMAHYSSKMASGLRNQNILRISKRKHNTNNLSVGLVRQDQLFNRYLANHLTETVCLLCYSLGKSITITVHSGLTQE